MCKLVKSDLLVLYDGSFEGFLTAVFKAYSMHVHPAGFSGDACAQASFCQELVQVETDMAQAERVRIGICNKAGYASFRHIEKAFYLHEHECEISLFAYIVCCMSGGRKAVSDPSDPIVASVERQSKRMDNEMECVRQFLRFELMDNGVYAAVINPCGDVLPLVTGYFASRYNTQPFVIYDEAHHLAALYDMKRVRFVKTSDFALPAKSDEEGHFQLLWKTFYDSLSNEQRFNPGLRTAQMPKRFWKNMTEMKAAVQGRCL